MELHEMYLQTILKRPDNEITKKIYNVQKEKPVQGDWTELVKNDFETFAMDYNEVVIENESKSEYKTKVKKHVREHVFIELIKKQASHSKICSISYKDFKTQNFY